MTYTVKEIFYSIQGEGLHTGRPAVFCRFASCNLWTGHEKDRHRAICTFCDTDFVGGEKYVVGDLVDAIEAVAKGCRFAVLTGGEPLLQVDDALLEELHRRDFYIAVETNGTIDAPLGIDWLTVSPKAGAAWNQRIGDELKVVYPQRLDLAMFERAAFQHLWLSPMDGPDIEANTAAALAFCLANPSWRLNIQTHKVVGVR